MNPQAENLNRKIRDHGSVAYELLSSKGRNIFFPRKGMVAQGLDAKDKTINASIGEAKEEDESPLRLAPLTEKVNLDPAEVFTYAPSFGKPAIRDIWQEKIRGKNPSLGTTVLSRPVTTNALTHGLSVAGYLFVDEGDCILLPSHYWGNYRLVFSEAYGAELQTFETFNREESGLNLDGMSDLLKKPGDKKILLLNFPNNPTGYTPSTEELNAIMDIVKDAAERGKKILAITDDAYFGLVYKNGVAEESPFAGFASLHENVLACKVDGATKEDYVWGFRVGFITFAGKGMGSEALTALEDKAAGAVRGSISNDSHLSQSLLLSLYRDSSYAAEKERAYRLLRSRYEAVVSELEGHPEYQERFKPLPYNSGYFMCVRVAGGDAEAVRQRLLSEYDTGVIAIGDLVRIAYSSLPTKNIPILFANLFRACGDVDGV